MPREPWAIPILRFGEEYESLETQAVHRIGTEEVLARVGQASAGMVRRDMRLRSSTASDSLRSRTCLDLLDIFKRAGDLFFESNLPVHSKGALQSPDDYVECLSATSGLPHSLCWSNMEKIRQALVGMKDVLHGLTRGLDPEALDGQIVQSNGLAVSYSSVARSLGAVLPSNSPGVNSLWLPALALKTPVIVKPGREEPWTPLRILRSLMEAGLPAEACAYYPTSHEGSAAILEDCDYSLLFGDAKVAKVHEDSRRVEVHGPGHSKVIIGEDEIDDFEQHLDVIVASILDNGGRSCVNASTICVPRRADELAQALAERMIEWVPRDPDDSEAGLAAFADPNVARWCDGIVEQGLERGGARDVTASLRQGPRLVKHLGATYLHPTLVTVPSLEHSLGNTEFMFPFCAVVDVGDMPPEKLVDAIGPSLVVSVITRDDGLRSALLDGSNVRRLNIGPVPTTRVDWNQPHEGNLFDALYTRRAIHRSAGW